jgi:hypothetical protein
MCVHNHSSELELAAVLLPNKVYFRECKRSIVPLETQDAVRAPAILDNHTSLAAEAYRR